METVSTLQRRFLVTGFMCIVDDRRQRRHLVIRMRLLMSQQWQRRRCALLQRLTVTNFAGSGLAEDDAAVATAHIAPIKVGDTLWLGCGGGQPSNF
ncbi:hypothetical protein PIB30_053572, partial [Stylosanthes scabra]|nr:hypothetical protein [Stylosanthes scabra]